MAKKKTVKRRKTTIKRTGKKRATVKRPVRRAKKRPIVRARPARKGYAFVVKLGDSYLTAGGDYASSQHDARRFHVRPRSADMPHVTGDRRRPRIVSLHLRQR